MLFPIYAAVYFTSCDITHMEKHLDASSSRMKGLTSGKKEASFKSSYQVCTVVSAGIRYIGSHMLAQKIWLTSLPQTELSFGSLCRLGTVISNIMLNIRNESKRPWQEPSRKSSAAETSHPKMEGGGSTFAMGQMGRVCPSPFVKQQELGAFYMATAYFSLNLQMVRMDLPASFMAALSRCMECLLMSVGMQVKARGQPRVSFPRYPLCCIFLDRLSLTGLGRTK